MTDLLMQYKDSIDKVPHSVSFEFFPPKNEEMAQHLWSTVDHLATLAPDYMTVTYGAGGSTKDDTGHIASTIKRDKGIDTAAHITCVGSSKDDIHNVLAEFKALGISRFVALRGDMPGLEGEYVPHENGYAYAADLVQGIRKLQPDVDISVAGYPEVHPQARSTEDDIHYLKDKVEAGADRIITQYCFDTDQILRYLDKVRQAGITVPVVPGIMVMANYKQCVSFSERCGTSVPQWFKNLCDGVDDCPIQRSALAVYLAVEQCRTLMQHGQIDEFHFYTLNRWENTTTICRLLGIRGT